MLSFLIKLHLKSKIKNTLKHPRLILNEMTLINNTWPKRIITREIKKCAMLKNNKIAK